jgi:hypothetical protein
LRVSYENGGKGRTGEKGHTKGTQSDYAGSKQAECRDECD